MRTHNTEVWQAAAHPHKWDDRQHGIRVVVTRDGIVEGVQWFPDGREADARRYAKEREGFGQRGEVRGGSDA
jgi:hypothetical protein